jgi:ketosteroid isomerase-like protein
MEGRHIRSKQELLKSAYTAFNRRDIDRVLTLMSHDVDWPNGMEGGRVQGHDQVRDYWRRQWSVLNPHVEPVRIEEDETDNTVVDVHQVVRDLSGNILVDQMVQHVYSIQNGLIERMDIRKPEIGPKHESLD